MVRSLWSGVSGLNAHQTRMDVIGNNIANVNTYGFKASRTSFSDVYYQAKKSATGGTTTFAGNNESAVGYGVEVSSIDKDMSTSSFQTTNRTLDLAITGDGFFMTATIDDMRNVDSVNYTRYGSFGVDSAGNLVNTLNRFVLGTNNNGTYTQKEMDDKTPAQDPMDLETINVNDRIWEAFRRYTEIDFTDVPRIYKGSPETVGGYTLFEDTTGGNTTYYIKDGDDYYALGTTMPSGGTINKDMTANPPTLTYSYVDTNGTTQTQNLTAAANAPANAKEVLNGDRTIYEGTDPYDSTNKVAYDRDLTTFSQLNATTGEVEAKPGVYYSEKLLNDDIQRDLMNGTNNVVPAAGTNDFILRSDYVLYYVGGKYVNNQGVEYDPEVGAYVDDDKNYYNYEVVTHVDDQGNVTKTHTYTRLKNGDDGKPKRVADPNANPAESLMTDSGHGFNGVNGAPFVVDTAPNGVFEYDDTTKAFQTQDAFGNTIFANMKMRPLSYGDLSGFSVGVDGSLTATYADEIKILGRVELATFDNPEGLDQIGETAFAESTNSGEPRVKSPGTMGAGKTSQTKLEMSNVNLANEFSDMIVTQRGFQANARIITTSDSMLEELVNMKR